MFAVVVCTVELVGEIEVEINSATYSFSGVGSDITGFVCKLDGETLPDCMSPYTHVFQALLNIIIHCLSCQVLVP